jgi:isoquinoline 1-oxidoreductase
MFGPALRAACAQARLVLTTLAAEKLGVPREALSVKGGVVSVIGDDKRSVGYGELSRGARIAQVVDQKAVLRAARDFTVMGTSPRRLDAVAKVTGAALYSADIRRPGMLYAAVLRPPAHGAMLARLDTDAAERLPGVTVVRQDGLLATLHADPQAAATALASVQAEWRMPAAGPDQEAIFDHLVAHASVVKQALGRGDLSAGRAGAAKVFDTTFRKGYVAHAPIETHAALAEFKDGRMTVWASTQTPFPARDAVAQALALDPAKVRVITPYVGGGFGGKSSGGQIVEAARLALATKRPVQVAWTRSEEFFNDTFDPAAVVTTSSGIGADGRIAFWDSTVWAAGERGASPVYDIAHARVRSTGGMSFEGQAGGAPPLHPFGVGPWRAPGANMNVFAIESQIDIMAAAAGIDPLEFRLRNMTDARMRRVLQAAAQAFGWTRAPAPSGRGVGIACSTDAGTCVATMAEVAVDRATGRISVLRIACSQDMGIVVNPEGARMQAVGGLNMGLGYTLGEELRFRGGDILDRNFDTYPLPRFSTVPPRIEVVLVKNDELAPQGGGEPSITTTGAVIANAVFDAIGVRMLRLPMTPARVRQAMAAAAGA